VRCLPVAPEGEVGKDADREEEGCVGTEEVFMPEAGWSGGINRTLRMASSMQSDDRDGALALD
jgi:hypothetical protein